SLGESFAVKVVDLKQQGLVELAKDVVRDEEIARSVTETLLDLSSERISRGEWKEAADVVKAAQLSAVKSRDAELRRTVGVRNREIIALAKAAAERRQAADT